MTDDRKQDLLELTADIVSAHVSNNSVSPADLPAVIAKVHASLAGLGAPIAAAEPEFLPAVPVRSSIKPDALISLIDGKPYKMLKRHLSLHGLTPDAYRQRYGLRPDYPMVASVYSEKRRELAKSIGLGLGGRGRKPAAKSKPAPKSKPAGKSVR